MFDIEDSVAPAAKSTARDLIVRVLREREFPGKLRSVRVNACDTPWCHEDLMAVMENAGDLIDSFIVPKGSAVQTMFTSPTMCY